MLRFFWITLLSIVPATALGQTRPVQPCPSDDLDPTFQALETTDHNYTLAINLRNISGEKCSVSSYPGGTGMDLPGGMGISICYHCEAGSQRPPEANIILNPGESAHQTRSWKTEPANGIADCGYVTQMNWDNVHEYAADARFWLFSRSLLKRICSTSIKVSDYSAGQFLSDASGAMAAGSRIPIIRWADEVTALSREHIPLRVTVEDPDQLASVGKDSCPRLFLRARDATPSRGVIYRWTRVTELQNASCNAETAGISKRFVIDFDASTILIQKNDENKGEYTLDVTSLVETDGRYRLMGATPALHLSMVNGEFIRRDWGLAVHGVAVSLNLDNDVYTLGSEIPLHIALENVDSPDPIAAMDPYYDPPGVGVELRDPAGNPIQPVSNMAWTGHGDCHRYPSGLLFPIELTLKELGFRPTDPGVYTIVAVWQPFLNDGCFIGMSPTLPAHLVVKSSPVTFRIIDSVPIPGQPDKQGP